MRVVALSRINGVVDLTDPGAIGDRLDGVDAVIDVSRSPSMVEREAADFFHGGKKPRHIGTRRCSAEHGRAFHRRDRGEPGLRVVRRDVGPRTCHPGTREDRAAVRLDKAQLQQDRVELAEELADDSRRAPAQEVRP